MIDFPVATWATTNKISFLTRSPGSAAAEIADLCPEFVPGLRTGGCLLSTLSKQRITHARYARTHQCLVSRIDATEMRRTGRCLGNPHCNLVRSKLPTLPGPHTPSSFFALVQCWRQSHTYAGSTVHQKNDRPTSRVSGNTDDVRHWFGVGNVDSFFRKATKRGRELFQFFREARLCRRMIDDSSSVGVVKRDWAYCVLGSRIFFLFSLTWPVRSEEIVRIFIKWWVFNK